MKHGFPPRRAPATIYRHLYQMTLMPAHDPRPAVGTLTIGGVVYPISNFRISRK
jgi:hypothetical protein